MIFALIGLFINFFWRHKRSNSTNDLKDIGTIKRVIKLEFLINMIKEQFMYRMIYITLIHIYLRKESGEKESFEYDYDLNKFKWMDMKNKYWKILTSMSRKYIWKKR